MNIDEATRRACKEPTLLDALSWIAVWESERAIEQAKKFFETGERTGSNGAAWDTCFRVCFERVMNEYPKSEKYETEARVIAIIKGHIAKLPPRCSERALLATVATDILFGMRGTDDGQRA